MQFFRDVAKCKMQNSKCIASLHYLGIGQQLLCDQVIIWPPVRPVCRDFYTLQDADPDLNQTWSLGISVFQLYRRQCSVALLCPDFYTGDSAYGDPDLSTVGGPGLVTWYFGVLYYFK